MKFPLFLLVCTILLQLTPAEPPKCYDNSDCHSSNYETYIGCVKRRYKRSVDCGSCTSGNCIDTCSSCNCNSCYYSNCETSCNSCCSSCCRNYVPCRTHHCCHKTCQAQCDTFDCRTTCRKNCWDIVNKGNEVDQDTSNSSNGSTSSRNDIRHNITTIINLNNVINNTNVIDIPIVVNNTNHQNITLYNENQRGGEAEQADKCCIVISPRQCVPTNESPYVRCFHYRSRQCGSFCNASIVHKEEKQVCQYPYPGGPPNCQQQVMYIPQPQPRCTYQSVWPYVSCGIQPPASCAGCYSHYADQSSRNYLTCPSGCYDNGYGVGPYYRQGPFYQPNYWHVPCYSCFGLGGYGNFGGYGGYGSFGGYGSYGGGFGGMGGYGAPGGFGGYGGYGGYNFGQPNPFGQPYPYAPPVVPLPQQSYGSWSPGEVTSFGNVSGSLDPQISVGPAIQPPVYDPLRQVRELEIEVNYEPKSPVQAEVKIKNDKTVRERRTTTAKVVKEKEGSTVADVANVTVASTTVAAKLS